MNSAHDILTDYLETTLRYVVDELYLEYTPEADPLIRFEVRLLDELEPLIELYGITHIKDGRVEYLHIINP